MLCLMIVFSNAVAGLRSRFFAVILHHERLSSVSFNINPATQDRKSLAAFEFLLVLITITV